MSIGSIRANNINNWICSRLNHMNLNHGKLGYVEYYKKLFNLPEEYSVNDTINYWKDDYNNHIKNVKEYFKDKESQLFIYDIDKNKFDDLKNFIPELKIIKYIHIKNPGKNIPKKKCKYINNEFVYN